MNEYLYRWELSLEADLWVQLEVSAANAVIARRTVDRFLVEHDGLGWRVESVSRLARRHEIHRVTCLLGRGGAG